MHLTLKTLGALEASTEDEGGTVRSLARGKPAAMLAYLACIPGHKASREHLATLLWGDVESEAARQNLRQTLWYLKKKLGDSLLEVTGEMLSLSVPFSCDRDEFLRAAQQADFAAAVQRHPGPFIPDFAAPGASEFEQWTDLERRRLTVTYLRCADALARQWLSEGKFRDAQDLARQARDVDPMDQATWRLLLEALVAGSDGLGAASEAEHLEAFLAHEEQEAEAATLAAIRMARRSPASHVPDEASPTASIAAELVGRETEFSHVLQAWEQVRQGTPRIVVITAAAGFGKSRLLRDVQARLRASRSRCLLVRANPGDRHISGGFVAEVASQLATLSGAAAVSTGTAGVLVALAPGLASAYASAAPDRTEGEDSVRRRALALVDLAHAVSDEHPVALLLDDLHWADDQSSRVITAALSRLEQARLLVVMAKRPAADPRGLFAPFERLELPPLDLSAVSAFVMQVAELPSTPWAEMLPQQLLLATGGSPLLLVETLHDALEQRLLSVSPTGIWQCDDPSRITSALRDGSAVRQRVMRLPPEARHALLALAIVGRPIELGDAVSMMGGRAINIDEPLETLERGGFIARLGTQLVVAHDEIADAALDASSEDQRQMVHRGVARGLLTSTTGETSLRRAAEHAIAGGDNALLTQTWRRFLRHRRNDKDARSTRLIAADFLQLDSASPQVQRLVAATPLMQRRRTPWMVAAGIVAAALLGLGSVQSRQAPATQTSDFAFWAVDSASGEGRFVGVRLDPNEPWRAGAPIEVTELDSTDFPHLPAGLSGPLKRSPDGRVWWGHVKIPEFGDEGIVIDSAGNAHMPLRWPGDDGIGSISPDGRYIAANTARYDTVTDHLQLVRLPVAGREIHRLTNNSEYDRQASWRPDGTQIVVQRHYYMKKSRDQACFVDVDGLRERCVDLPFDRGDVWLSGWIDERRLLLGSASGAFLSLDAENGHVDSVPGVSGHLINHDGELRVCLCRVSQENKASLYLMPSANPGALRPLMYRGRPLRGRSAFIGAPFPKGQWLDRLTLRLPDGGLPVDLVHRLSVEGRRANGSPAWLHDLRWVSRDTSVAIVDATGRLVPRRLGETWIIVSAGGWRTDSALARIRAPSSQTVLTESWTKDWTQRWTPIGSPPGIVVPTDRGPALLPNGDGSYVSGAFTPVSFAATKGVGFEADVSLRITRTQWQTLTLDLHGATALEALRKWDLRTGAGPSMVATVCNVGFPADEGIVGLDHFVLANPQQTTRFPTPAGLYSGAWHRLRMQVFADGQCGIAIDGRPVGIIAAPAGAIEPQVFAFFSGHDRWDGRLVVGHVEIWSGVRGGIDWTVLDAVEATKKKP